MATKENPRHKKKRKTYAIGIKNNDREILAPIKNIIIDSDNAIRILSIRIVINVDRGKIILGIYIFVIKC